MSERAKLERDFLAKYHRPFTMADFIVAVGRLVENCKHEKTHWLQEIGRDGEFRNYLVKRCFLCGVNVDELDVEPEIIEKILAEFDKACETEKRKILEKSK